ncbi:50S ribosomal protein L5 [Geopsychrobacter electrodiphilus]|uniref:50S ribosomal protein L5 n=1 Tax=Geopsychrobacter electrodiphilus TaxID=225196 RepID=UPI00035F01D2|nr:50S ribosomal protein L5 [Geopsychrobacter electrodiphilus]
MARLKQAYQQEQIPALMKEFQYRNVMEVPRIEKVVLNMGLGEAIQNPKLLESAVEELSAITGQKAIITRAKRSIAGFKLREDMPIGACVTLRHNRAWEFLDRLINVALPRVRDFKGVSSKAFDGRGNYTLGVREQLIFPEIDLEKIAKVSGLNITIVTTAKTDEEGRALLTGMGMPFRK